MAAFEALSVPLWMIDWTPWKRERLGLGQRQNCHINPEKDMSQQMWPQAKAARAELLTLRHLAKTTKNCPKCQILSTSDDLIHINLCTFPFLIASLCLGNFGIEKSEGCSKVLCGRASEFFVAKRAAIFF